MSDETIHPLERMMDDLHEALRQGQLPLIETLVPRIEAEVEKGAVRDQVMLERLHAKAIRNGHLLAAAGRGIRAAQTRLSEIKDVRSGLTTYDRSGMRMDRLARSNLTLRY